MTAVLPGGAAPSPTPSTPGGTATPIGPATPPASPSTTAVASRSTPARLRTLQLVVVVVCIALGVVLFVGASSRRSQIAQAERASDLVVAAQDLRSALGRADAASVTAFLAGGVDQPEQRARYTEAIEQAAAALQRAGAVADSDEADTAITALQQQLPTYAGLIETARANNRQNLPLGAAYLRSASDLVRTDVDAQLDALRDAGEQSFRDVDDDLAGGLGVTPLAMITLVAVVLAATARWLTGRTRRLLNPGLVVAAAVLVVGIGWIANANRNSAQSAVDAMSDGYDRLSALSLIRSDAYDHQAKATFALVDRGGAERYNAQAATAVGNVDARLAALDERGRLSDPWQDYLARSQAITELGPARYVEARDAVTAALTEPDSVGAAFEAFDGHVVDAVEQARETLRSGLDETRSPISRIRIIGIVVGLAAAAAAAWGLQQRLNDYR